MKSTLLVVALTSLAMPALGAHQQFGRAPARHVRRQDMGIALVGEGMMAMPAQAPATAAAPVENGTALANATLPAPVAGEVNGTALAGEVNGTALAGEVNGTALAGEVNGTALAGGVNGTALAGEVNGTALAGEATPAGNVTAVPPPIVNGTAIMPDPAQNISFAGTNMPASTVGAAMATPPTGKDQSADLTVLNLAFTLEQLESQFYAEGLRRWGQSDFQRAGFSERQSKIIIEQLTIVQRDESVHASTLSSVITSLGSTAITSCNFNFRSVMQDPMTFISVARSLESVGISAYLGAAHLLTDPALLTAAGSILTLEARHQSLLNVFNGGSFGPQPFDIALSPSQVLALAGGFLEGCSAKDFGLTSNEPLSITEQRTQTTRFSVGSQLVFTSTVTIQQSGQFCQMLVGGAPSAQVFPGENCIVPQGVDGPVAVYLTGSNTPLQSNLLQQDITAILAGPGLIFVDSRQEEISTLFETSNSRSMGCANFGSMGMNQRSNNRRDVIEVVIHETIIIRVDNNGNSRDNSRNSRESNSRNYNSRNWNENSRNGNYNSRNRNDNSRNGNYNSGNRNSYNGNGNRNSYGGNSNGGNGRSY